MVEQVEELQAELQLRRLTKEMTGQRPVLVQREVHILDTRTMALSDAGLGCLAENIPVHSEGCRVDPLALVSTEARLACQQRPDTEVLGCAVAKYPPRRSEEHTSELQSPVHL